MKGLEQCNEAVVSTAITTRIQVHHGGGIRGEGGIGRTFLRIASCALLISSSSFERRALISPWRARTALISVMSSARLLSPLLAWEAEI